MYIAIDNIKEAIERIEKEIDFYSSIHMEVKVKELEKAKKEAVKCLKTLKSFKVR